MLKLVIVFEMLPAAITEQERDSVGELIENI